jgi:phage regulator Rha-like protein
MQNLINKSQLTMSSREIAELVEKLSANFKPQAGHVYVIESRDSGIVKIGKSINPKERISTITNMAGGAGQFYFSPLVRNHSAIESALHKHFCELRTKGEWFAIPYIYAKEIVDLVCSDFLADEDYVINIRSAKTKNADRVFNGMQDFWRKKMESTPPSSNEYKFSKTFSVATNELTMSSNEIAGITGKQHKNVIRDIREMLKKIDGQYSFHDECQEVMDNRGYTAEIRLNYRLCILLVTGYSEPHRLKVIDRWQELEQQSAMPQIVNPNLQAIMKMLVETDRAQQLAASMTSQDLFLFSE